MQSSGFRLPSAFRIARTEFSMACATFHISSSRSSSGGLFAFIPLLSAHGIKNFRNEPELTTGNQGDLILAGKGIRNRSSLSPIESESSNLLNTRVLRRVGEKRSFHAVIGLTDNPPHDHRNALGFAHAYVQ